MFPSSSRFASACTIIARNYVPHARILASSYLKHHPGARFYVLFVDGVPNGIRFEDGVRLLSPDDLGLDDFYRLTFKYSVTELCTAVKPSLLSWLLKVQQEPRIVYFDPDILITRSLTEMTVALTNNDIVVIPHLLDPIPLDGLKPTEQDILIAGAYNLGFIGVRDSDMGHRFLDWWSARLADHCRVDPANGLFVDQRWVDLVPGLFRDTFILTDDTYDVAYWNLHSRRLDKRGQAFSVNGRPLAFFHFSGFDASKRHLLSRHQTRVTVVRGSPLAELLDLYGDLQMSNGFAEAQRIGYRYACFDNGIPLDQVTRDLYLTLEPAVRRGFGDPFLTQLPGSFFQWATSPQGNGMGPSPFLMNVYALRADVRRSMPRVPGRDQERFVRWARSHGVKELGYDLRLAESGRRTPHAENVRPIDSRDELPEPAGVNVCGYLRNETGLGAVARGYVSCLDKLGIPRSLRDFGHLSPNRSGDLTLTRLDQTFPYAINLVCANADQHFVIMNDTGEGFFRNHYNIGVWFWELPVFPKEWWDRFPYYNEIWASSSFIRDTVAKVSPIPVFHMPPVISERVSGVRERGRRRLGVPDNHFLFLFIFDFRSYAERKNPLGLVDAFKAAFHPTEPVRLAIKCVNGNFDSHALEKLRSAIAGSPISLWEDYWSPEEISDSLAACDAYVSLHRSEGLGLTMAEAMAYGKPVIATNWSGNTDFMTPDNSFPVDFELIELEHDVGPYKAGHSWANPSIEHAAQLMRSVFVNRELCMARGQEAQRHIRTKYSAETVANQVRERLKSIQPAVPTNNFSRALKPHDSLGDIHPIPGETGLYSKAPIVPPMELEKSVYGRFGRLAKRLVSLLLSYHTLYQQQVNFSFSAFMRELEVTQREQDLKLADLQQTVAQLAQRLPGPVHPPEDFAHDGGDGGLGGRQHD